LSKVLNPTPNGELSVGTTLLHTEGVDAGWVTAFQRLC